MKTNVVLIHGYNATPELHWLPWLKTQLEQKGIRVVAPELPLQEKQTVADWTESFESVLGHVNEHTIMIAHSMGCPFMLSVLAQLEQSIHCAIYVAPFARVKEGKVVDSDRKSFIENIAWKKARKGARKHHVFASTTDKSIPMLISAEFAASLKCDMTPVSGAEHFMKRDGYDVFGRLFEYVMDQVYVTYDEFQKLDMRVGEIKEVEEVSGSDKLLRCQVDLGESDLRQIVSGIKHHLGSPQEIVGKKVLYVTNLAPREIMGVISNGMLMATGDEETSLAFMIPDKDIRGGSTIR